MAIDVTMLILAAYGFYIGYVKGVIKTIFSALSYLLGLMAAMKFSPYMTQFLEDNFSRSPMMFIVGFVATFIGVMLVVRVIARAVEGFFKTIKINFINKILGGALMMSLFTLLFSVIVWFGDQSRLINPKTKDTSFSYPYLIQIPSASKGVLEKFKPMFQEFWDYAMDYMDRLKKEAIESEEETNVH